MKKYLPVLGFKAIGIDLEANFRGIFLSLFFFFLLRPRFCGLEAKGDVGVLQRFRAPSPNFFRTSRHGN